MPPDFSKKTIDILTKRAAFKCSNPDCRVSTVGPSSEVEKVTVIGEAAHIQGARQGSQRFAPEMNDGARAEITNAIWLCRNCHKLIDSDEHKYDTNLLYAWRELHEKYVSTELGNASDKIKYEEQASTLSQFEGYPYIVRRIAADQAVGWEYRLTAELMRHLNQPQFRRMKDLRSGLYVGQQAHIENDQVIPWIEGRLAECAHLTDPIEPLMRQLTESWGALGESGDINKIHHLTKLFRDYLERVVEYEERIYFANVPDKYQRLLDLLKGLLMSQIEQVSEIPDYLDECVALIGSDHEGTPENPLIIDKTITLNVPDDWTKRFNRELKRTQGIQSQGGDGCLQLAIVLLVIFIIIAIFG